MLSLTRVGFEPTPEDCELESAPMEIGEGPEHSALDRSAILPAVPLLGAQRDRRPRRLRIGA